MAELLTHIGILVLVRAPYRVSDFIYLFMLMVSLTHRRCRRVSAYSLNSFCSVLYLLRLDMDTTVRLKMHSWITRAQRVFLLCETLRIEVGFFSIQLNLYYDAEYEL